MTTNDDAVVPAEDVEDAVDRALDEARMTTGWDDVRGLENCYTRGDAGAVILPRDTYFQLIVTLEELVERAESANREYSEGEDFSPDAVADTYALMHRTIDNDIQRLLPQLQENAQIVVDDDD